jgi:hypothetical protein
MMILNDKINEYEWKIIQTIQVKNEQFFVRTGIPTSVPENGSSGLRKFTDGPKS